MAKTTQIIIMAAGQGKRMRSQLPKVLHRLAGRPLLAHVLSTAKKMSPDKIAIVIGHGAAEVAAAFATEKATFVTQHPPQGTGDAVKVALSALEKSGDADVTLVMNGDCPLIPEETLARLIDAAQQNRLAWLTAVTEQPFGLGRILRDEHGVCRGIVEERDASDEQRRIREINAGVIAAPTQPLKSWVARLTRNNAQNEYYLTDILPMAIAEGMAVETILAAHEEDTRGINDRAQLAEVEHLMRKRTASRLMSAGVTLADPHRIDVRGTLSCEPDVSIDVGCIFEGEVTIARGTVIGAYSIIKNSTLGEGVTIHPYSHIEGAIIAPNATIGPYARLRPKTVIGDAAKVGNFVELKATTLGAASKANHLSYLGDAIIGENVNIGAGTITCNYDGANKHQTVIKDRVFVGSHTALVAPMTVEADATIGAGSTLSEDVLEHSLTFTRTHPIIKPNWRKPKKSHQT